MLEKSNYMSYLLLLAEVDSVSLLILKCLKTMFYQTGH